VVVYDIDFCVARLLDGSLSLSLKKLFVLEFFFIGNDALAACLWVSSALDGDFSGFHGAVCFEFLCLTSQQIE